MKKNISLLASVVSVLLLTGCGTTKFLDTYAPEESSLNVQKITDESSNSVLGCRTFGSFVGAFAASSYAGSKEEKFYWSTPRLLSVSPDGREIGYLSRNNKQDNIMIRSAFTSGAATQRTFRNVTSFSWGADNQLYFADNSDVEHSQVCSADAHAGSLIRQLTNNNIDSNPVISSDGSTLFFTRVDKSGPSIWSLNIKSGALTACARGYSPCLIKGDNNRFYCVRNNSNGMSEIWLVNYVVGQETLILSDKKHSYSNPSLSPDGQWIVCQGNSKSSITKKQNLDIYAIRTDGTGLIQLTFHPSTDCSPVFSADGSSIFFLSDRANKDNYYNVWKLTFAHY